ncbi:hypothetical protein [Sulfobacillus thermosulfidooxidans]|uniref:hypothetical protein n=1 Tax=Sulfobacillus thermosulfidooxidans TaxID=28034 RepID=UPI00037F2FD0|nr:hypothetical protein [Sulfobacillus thermosulfidooxidans]
MRWSAWMMGVSAVGLLGLGVGFLQVGLHSDGAPRLPRTSTARSRGRIAPRPPVVPLGTVAWARQMRHQLTRQWHHTAPPLWIAPDPRRPHTWVIVAPLAYQDHLWWAYATPQQPTPRFQSLPDTLSWTAQQIVSLPPPMQGAVSQAADLLHDRPWPLTVSLPPMEGQGAMTAVQAEAMGTFAAPVGWSVVWNPMGTTAGTLWVTVTLPWTPHTMGVPILTTEGMGWSSAGSLVSSGILVTRVDAAGSPVPVTDRAILQPPSVAAGLSGL